MFLLDDIDFVQTQSFPVSDLWYFLPIGYLFTILIETPILLVGLPRKLSFKQKLLCGIWLTACTYPIVILVLPTLFFGESRTLYLIVAETFAPVAECVLFWLVIRRIESMSGADWVISFIVITIANLASFVLGELMNAYEWFGVL